ncbi:MAG: right-handed parallel beta-helix repeat-containing protein [Planctomycetota bacterium]|jgi:hypothetical protein
MFRKSSYLLSFVLLAGLFSVSAMATDYYIDPVSGSDTTGDGSLGNPWKSFTNIISYYTGSYRPSGWVDIQAGDTIYLMNGTHNTIVHPGDGGGPSGGGSQIAYFRHEDGNSSNWIYIKAYPGHSPVMDPQYNGKGINIYQCEYWDVSGIEIRNAYSRGVVLGDSDHIKVYDMEIHDTNGRNDNNICGLEVKNTGDVEVYDCVFYDNYDRTGAQGHPANSTGMVCFNGFNQNHGDVIVHDCQFYQTQPTSGISGAGLKYKHSNQNPAAVFHVYNNTFRNNKYFGVGSGNANTHVHHNLFVEGGSIRSVDEGGITHQNNQLFEYNTIYKSKAFTFNPTTNYINEDFPNDPNNIVYRNNIAYDIAASYGSENGMVDVGCYMTDVLYYLTLPEMHFHKNCYYNPNRSAQFNIAAGFNYKPEYAEGGQYSFSQWQSIYGYDLDSVETDPLFIDAENDDFRLQPCSPCANMGVYAGDLDGDTIIGWGDLKVICDNWLQSGPEIEGDLDNDDDVNFDDLAEFGLVW